MLSFRSTVVFISLSSLALAQLQPLLSSVTFPNNPLVNVDVTTLSNALLVNNAVLLGALGPANCPPGGIIATTPSPVLNQANVCVCLNIGLTQPIIPVTPCAGCPLNSSPTCNAQNPVPCACACNPGFVADAQGVCTAVVVCPGNQVEVAGVCQCPAGQIDNGAGTSTCVLAPSPAARRRIKREPLVLSACPSGEQACPLASGGYECLDTTTSLDSCGGCLGKGGVNCLAIQGALSVECAESKCAVSSCFPGWRYINGKCARSH